MAAALLSASHIKGEARAQPAQAKHRKQVDFAEAQMGVATRRPMAGHREAHSGMGRLSPEFPGWQAAQRPSSGFRLLWDTAINGRMLLWIENCPVAVRLSVRVQGKLF